MIASWREAFRQGDFPFLFVQLAPFGPPAEDDWAGLWEAQLMTLDASPNTAMAVITDLGDETDIHPKQKEPVGERLALAARALAYDEDIVYSGPIFESMRVNGDRAILRFEHVGGGLKVEGEELLGFEIAGSDGTFVPAQARIRRNGRTIVVRADGVDTPTAVRYGWNSFPTVNLYNEEGLPASPFRTNQPE
jgi:sialate O-acetylesterase